VLTNRVSKAIKGCRESGPEDPVGQIAWHTTLNTLPAISRFRGDELLKQVRDETATSAVR